MLLLLLPLLPKENPPVAAAPKTFGSSFAAIEEPNEKAFVFAGSLAAAGFTASTFAAVAPNVIPVALPTGAALPNTGVVVAELFAPKVNGDEEGATPVAATAPNNELLVGGSFCAGVATTSFAIPPNDNVDCGDDIPVDAPKIGELIVSIFLGISVVAGVVVVVPVAVNGDAPNRGTIGLAAAGVAPNKAPLFGSIDDGLPKANAVAVLLFLFSSPSPLFFTSIVVELLVVIDVSVVVEPSGFVACVANAPNVNPPVEGVAVVVGVGTVAASPNLNPPIGVISFAGAVVTGGATGLLSVVTAAVA